MFRGISAELDPVACDAIGTRVQIESSELDGDGMLCLRDLDEIPFRDLAHDACMPQSSVTCQIIFPSSCGCMIPGLHIAAIQLVP